MYLLPTRGAASATGEDTVSLQMALMLAGFCFLEYHPNLRDSPLLLCCRGKLIRFGEPFLRCGIPLPIWITTICGGQWITWGRR